MCSRWSSARQARSQTHCRFTRCYTACRYHICRRIPEGEMERGVVIRESGVHRMTTFRQASCQGRVSSWKIACRFRERCPHTLEHSVALQLPEQGSGRKGIRRRSCQNLRNTTATVTQKTGTERHGERDQRRPPRFGYQFASSRSVVGNSHAFAGLGYQRGNAASVTDFHGSAAWKDSGVTSTPPTFCPCKVRRCSGVGFRGPGNQEYNPVRNRISMRIEEAL
jgi:hypothetical protein